jgi:hypothetical protein
MGWITNLAFVCVCVHISSETDFIFQYSIITMINLEKKNVAVLEYNVIDYNRKTKSKWRACLAEQPESVSINGNIDTCFMTNQQS